ncbi:hypothetical protein QBC35DRAFT_169277 [Podospora australis]|uniref:Rhodopsin n=1 Tax=Podospora australis TaxID=1536484 RepID=A0AAN6WI05_9PEZI|nr:hypothetical protein QBC35DRAFT_169277 [Podospora australis]
MSQYPPQQGGYYPQPPPQGYPPQGYPPPDGGYPPQGYPPQGYPPPQQQMQYQQAPPPKEEKSHGCLYSWYVASPACPLAPPDQELIHLFALQYRRHVLLLALR